MAENTTPTLPDGYYFVVTEVAPYSVHDNDRLRVALNRRRKWWFDSEIYAIRCGADKYDVMVVMGILKIRIEKELSTRAPTKELVGRYPPKTL